MGDKSQPTTSRQEPAGQRFAQWAATRMGTDGRSKRALRRAFPDHWSFMLWETALYSFVVLVVTGVYLSFFFHPSAEPKVYHGSYGPLNGQTVSDAFDSTMHISFEVRGGLLMRQAHHWAALIFLAAVIAHLMRVFFTGAFRKPRELNWVLGFLLLVVGMVEGLTGYDLPGDLLSGTGLAVVNGTLLAVPVVGTYLSSFLFGGEFPGHALEARFAVLHILVLPAVLTALVAAHLALRLRHRHTQWAGPGRTERNVVGLPLRVYAVKSAGYFFLVAGVIFTMGAVAQINPVWEYGPYRPDQVSAGSQPDWYMGALDGLLRVMPGWEVTLWGHTLVLDTLVPLLAGVSLFLALGAYPFIEARFTGDRREHHLLDRPRNRPVRTALGTAWLSMYLLTLVAGANDLIATRFGVSVNAVTWVVRIGLFTVPPVVYTVTKRLALGLQQRDRDMVLHGRETGVIVRLPNGGYRELHERLDQRRLDVLTAHQPPRPLP
ncbi:cytochrome b [Streptomyces sp. NRRL F-5123]|uniref:cytochrome bc1 complex cytochrome b subunit n=1 Tax=Streptomyces sp. NRRL F-5123 TaxID=1463856 RepID=UPI0004E1B7FF|nr:ubiquinol-cytochrome c reductase cytochrome b subunit [Streptomyces sp. NRRL F-5123]